MPHRSIPELNPPALGHSACLDRDQRSTVRTASLLRRGLCATPPEKLVPSALRQPDATSQERNSSHTQTTTLSQVWFKHQQQTTLTVFSPDARIDQQKFSLVPPRCLVRRLKSASNANVGAAAESLHSVFRLHDGAVRGQPEQLAKSAVLILLNPQRCFLTNVHVAVLGMSGHNHTLHRWLGYVTLRKTVYCISVWSDVVFLLSWGHRYLTSPKQLS